MGTERSRFLETQKLCFRILHTFRWNKIWPIKDSAAPCIRKQCSELSCSFALPAPPNPHSIQIFSFHISKIKWGILAAYDPPPQKGRHCDAEWNAFIQLCLCILAYYPGFQKEWIWNVLVWFNDTLQFCPTLCTKRISWVTVAKLLFTHMRPMTTRKHKVWAISWSCSFTSEVWNPSHREHHHWLETPPTSSCTKPGTRALNPPPGMWSPSTGCLVASQNGEWA